MIEFRWIGRELQYRQRSFEVDASTHFCGLTDFGPWEDVPEFEACEQKRVPDDFDMEPIDALIQKVQRNAPAACELEDCHHLPTIINKLIEFAWLAVNSRNHDCEQEIEDRDNAQDAADSLASLVLGEPIDWPFHNEAWQRAIEKLKHNK